MSPELIGFFRNKKSVTFQNATFLPNTQFITLKIYTLIYKTSVGVFLFFVSNLCAVTFVGVIAFNSQFHSKYEREMLKRDLFCAIINLTLDSCCQTIKQEM